MNIRIPISIVAALALTVSVAPAQTVREGRAAPDIDLETLDGRRIRLSNLRGHPVIVSFWATWCPPCRGEFKELVQAYDALSPGGLRILAVNGRDQELSISDVQEFIAQFEVKFDVVLDKRGKARRAYGLIGLPTTVFIDSAGVVKKVHFGVIDHEQLATGISMIHLP